MRSINLKQQGFLSVIAVILILVISFIGITMSYMLSGSATATNNFQQGERAFYLAESGLEDATHQLLNYSVADRATCTGLNISNILSTGNAYSVTATPIYASTPTTISSALTATAGTIPVTSTANYSSTGRIMIDQELINYTGVTSTSFTGVSRGVDASTATTHTSGTRVGQYECDLTSTGGLPNLTTPLFKRTLKQGIQLQEAWAVGDTSSLQLNFIRFNRPAEGTWTNVNSMGLINLLSVFMVSYVDAWAVGNSNTFYRWNGSSWTTVASGLGGTTFQSVFCTSASSCEVVGAGRKIGHWNGTAWAILTPTGSIATTNLNSVHCISNAYCWAVGSSTGGGKFYVGSGSPLAWVGVHQSALTVFAAGNAFNEVFCIGTSDCWAVGTGNVFARKATTSNTWTNLSTGLPNVQYNSIYCNSTSDCWAVGNVSGGQDVIARWNNSTWTRYTPNPTPSANLQSVTCAQPNDCWAVGVTSSGTNSAYIHWDGTSWTQIATSSPATTIRSISIVSASSRPWAVWNEVYA